MITLVLVAVVNLIIMGIFSFLAIGSIEKGINQNNGTVDRAIGIFNGVVNTAIFLHMFWLFGQTLKTMLNS